MPKSMTPPSERYGPEFSYEVEPAKIREFAVALGSLDAIHTDKTAALAAGYRDIVAPVGLIVWTIVQDREALFRAFELDADRGLASGEGWEIVEPICAGDTLSGRTRHVSVERRERRGEWVEVHRLETRYHNQLGAVPLIEHTTIMQWQRSPFASSAEDSK